MTLKVQHKRSAVKGKAPLPADLEYGEIAVNYEKTDPALYIKDSDNVVRKIGSKPPTVTSDTAPANPADGDLWYDSVGGELYVWYDSDDAGAAVGTWVQANPQPTPKQATTSVAGVDVKLWKKTGTTLGAETTGDVVDIAAVPTIPDAGATNARLTGTTCKAWVNFNGIGTVGIRARYNVSSITDNGAGDYTVNFAAALTDGDYCSTVVPLASAVGTSITESVSQTTSALRFRTCFNGAAGDYNTLCVAIFR